MKLKKIILTIFTNIIISTFLFCGACVAQSDEDLYEQALIASQEGEKDFAFMYLHALLQFSTASVYYKEALFATGEYYYAIGAYKNAEESFTELIASYPKTEAFPFAVAYLIRLNRRKQIITNANDLRKKVITFKRLSLLFSEFKELFYKSPLNTQHKAIYFIDRVEIYIEGRLFEKIYF